MSTKKQTKLTEMTNKIKKALQLNKARATCFTAVCTSAIENKSILLADSASMIQNKAKTESKVRRLQNFFTETRIDYKKIALLTMTLANINPKEKMVLALDRTNWTTRKNEVNILTLSVCTGDTGIPIFWNDLQCKGNSNTKERTDIIRQFTSFFGAQQIKCLVCDREFIGEDWFAWLKNKNIPFVCRLKENFLVKTNGQKSHIKHFFHDVPNGGFKDLGIRNICGIDLHICGVKDKSGELMILGSHGVFGQDAVDSYLLRWNIEIGFSQLKTRGFNIEETRLQGDGKMDLLFAVLAVSMAWCYSCGSMTASVFPIKLASHGRKKQSVFRLGLEVLRACLRGAVSVWSFFYEKILDVFASAVAFVASVFPVCRLKNSLSRRWV